MNWKTRQRIISLRIILRQNKGAFFCIFLWFATTLSLLVAQGIPTQRALRIMTYLEPSHDSALGFFYQSTTDFVFFGLVVSLLMGRLQKQVRPEITSRVIAKELSEHAVVIGLNNLGRRAFELFTEHHIPVAVIDRSLEAMDDLIHDGYPCLVSCGRSAADLDDVNIGQAKLVLVAYDDLEVVPVICSLVRRANPSCTLIVSCHEDNIGEVLAQRYRAHIISTSKLAAQFLHSYASRRPVQHAIVVGCGQLGRRIIPVLQRLNCEFVFLMDDSSSVEDLVDEHTFLFGPSHDLDLLDAAGARRADLVVITEDSLARALTTVDRIRRINTDCRIVCRVFHDDSADMLSNPPFRCDVISTSRYTVEHLKSQGAFLALGLSPDLKSKRNRIAPLPPPQAPPANLDAASTSA